MIELTPENVNAIGDALLAEHKRVTAELEAMTETQAREVRRLRVDEHGTWGYIGGRYGGGQILGRALCYRAAVVLGEDPHDEPWN